MLAYHYAPARVMPLESSKPYLNKTQIYEILKPCIVPLSYTTFKSDTFNGNMLLLKNVQMMTFNDTIIWQVSKTNF
jgi:hypothetical protein